jgi:hypothetical protein
LRFLLVLSYYTSKIKSTYALPKTAIVKRYRGFYGILLIRNPGLEELVFDH